MAAKNKATTKPNTSAAIAASDAIAADMRDMSARMDLQAAEIAAMKKQLWAVLKDQKQKAVLLTVLRAALHWAETQPE
jgi:hypothetical protein